MKKRNLLPFLLLIICAGPVSAQASEEDSVKSAIRQLFEGMKNGDSAMVKDVFDAGAVLQTIIQPKGAGAEVRTTSLEKFLTAVGAPHTDVWDERISFGTVLIDGALATVWTPYSFYLNDQFSHCGVNSFQLYRSAKGWKIVHLIDTRRKEGCL